MISIEYVSKSEFEWKPRTKTCDNIFGLHMSSTMLNHNQHFNTHPLVKLVMRDSEIYHCIPSSGTISTEIGIHGLYDLGTEDSRPLPMASVK